MRNDIVAAGKEFDSEDRLDPIPQSVVSPALLFDELEVKRGDVAEAEAAGISAARRNRVILMPGASVQLEVW